MNWTQKFEKDPSFSIAPEWFAEAVRDGTPEADLLARVKAFCEQATGHPVKDKFAEMMYEIYRDACGHE